MTKCLDSFRSVSRRVVSGRPISINLKSVFGQLQTLIDLFSEGSIHLKTVIQFWDV